MVVSTTGKEKNEFCVTKGSVTRTVCTAVRLVAATCWLIATWSCNFSVARPSLASCQAARRVQVVHDGPPLLVRWRACLPGWLDHDVCCCNWQSWSEICCIQRSRSATNYVVDRSISPATRSTAKRSRSGNRPLKMLAVNVVNHSADYGPLVVGLCMLAEGIQPSPTWSAAKRTSSHAKHFGLCRNLFPQDGRGQNAFFSASLAKLTMRADVLYTSVNIGYHLDRHDYGENNSILVFVHFRPL